MRAACRFDPAIFLWITYDRIKLSQSVLRRDRDQPGIDRFYEFAPQQPTITFVGVPARLLALAVDNVG